MAWIEADWVGSLAATLTTICFVPQLIQVIRTKDATSISLAMYLLFCLGVALWLIYGLLIGRWPIILSNILTLSLAGTILIYKIRSK